MAEAIAFIIGADKVLNMAREAQGEQEEDRLQIQVLLDSQIIVDMLNGRSNP